MKQNKWVIDKQFSFCYGHRVWTQELNTDFCDKSDVQAKCRHLHGHEGLVHVFLEADTLSRGMVTDFKHLGWAKNFIDDILDHKFVIDINDPLYNQLVTDVFVGVLSASKNDDTGEVFDPLSILKPVFVPGTNAVACQTLRMDMIEFAKGTPEYEQLEGYTVVDFVPTSENLSKWIYDVIAEKMKYLAVDEAQSKFKVSRVDWFETPKSRSSYVAE